MHSSCILDSVANLLVRHMVFVGNCFASLPPPISVSGEMEDANVTQRHKANMASRLTL